jgi:hypothetical protein
MKTFFENLHFNVAISRDMLYNILLYLNFKGVITNDTY